MEEWYKKIKSLRIAKNLSQKELGKLIDNKSQSTVSNIEDGKIDIVTIEMGKMIAKVLEVPFNELFDIELNSNEIGVLINEINTLNQTIENSSNLIDKLNKDKNKLKEIYLLDFVYYSTIEIYGYFVELDSSDGKGIQDVIYDAVWKLDRKKKRFIKDINSGLFTEEDYRNAIDEFNRIFSIYPVEFPDKRRPTYEVYNLLEISDLEEIFINYLTRQRAKQ